MRDLEVIDYFLGMMQEASSKLDRLVIANRVDEADNIKKIILDISDNISKELE